MALFSYHRYSSQVLFAFVLFLVFKGVSGATFTFVNKCNDTVWPGIIGKPELGSTGFELIKGSFRNLQAPTGWSGRFWARTGCNFNYSGHGTCTSGDCGSGEINCNGAGAIPPATLLEFTLGSGSSDFYDVSLVDGYNMPMTVEARGGSGPCGTTGCEADLYRRCPAELRVNGSEACKSACLAFNKPKYCCTGAFNTRSTCKPTVYSYIFKSACPKAYSYAYDDANSTFTCTGANYTVTFCPSASFPSLKPWTDAYPNSTNASPNSTDSSPGSGSDSSVDQAALASTLSWLASLTKGPSTRSQPFAASKSAFLVAITSFFVF